MLKSSTNRIEGRAEMLGQAWVGKGKLAKCRDRADSAGKTVQTCAAIVYIGYM
jgi:hypothetical protein